MKKVFKWIGITYLALMVLSMIVNATKTPEEKAVEQAAREQAMAAKTEEKQTGAEAERSDYVACQTACFIQPSSGPAEDGQWCG